MTTETPLLITCPRCRHTWMPRVAAPVKCPICQCKLQLDSRESLKEEISELRQRYYTPGTPEYENRTQGKERHIRELKEKRASRNREESDMVLSRKARIERRKLRVFRLNHNHTNCSICFKDLGDSKHHFFCNDCWKMKEATKNRQKREAQASNDSGEV